jgi:hypothetical protein
MAIADRAGLPVSISISSASPHEVTLVDAALDHVVTDAAPARLIGDAAYDSDPLDRRLAAQHAITMIAPPSGQSPPPPARRPAPPTLPPPLEDRTTLCLATELPPDRHALRV